ncbi:2Fe-2S iron-sulfur cluster-binding protein [Nocardia sp. NPDC057455]|uniref:2Fe-2S iron-sulfur cluster-binding protein n=1 Tax=Nocardia sp. NPDC057455 TaxID=3346138 RepID=UPI00367301B6
MTVDQAGAAAVRPTRTGIPGGTERRPGSILPLRVARVIRETGDAVSLELDVAAQHPDSIAYRPGQFLTLRIPSELTGSVSRCYSLSSAPHEEGPLKVTVKRTPDGYGSNWLCDNAVAGTVLDALPPAGVFTPASLDDDLLLFAAGSGITPVLSILKSVLAAGSGHCTLIYANRDEHSVIFAAELADLSARHPGRLVVVHWLESVQGLPSRAQLAALAGPWSDREAFICGPGPFMDAVSATLIGLGAGRERVHVEKFVSLDGNPFESGIPEVFDSGDRAAVEVDLDGETRELPWPRQQVLLDVLLANGLEAPYSCREGACSACTCRIVSGQVQMRHNEVLDEADLAEGYVLACQAVPVTDTVRVTYS